MGLGAAMGRNIAHDVVYDVCREVVKTGRPLIDLLAETNEGYSTMCGHGVIALTTVLLETGMVQKREPRTEVIYDSPAGLIRAQAMVEDGQLTSVAVA